MDPKHELSARELSLLRPDNQEQGESKRDSSVRPVRAHTSTSERSTAARIVAAHESAHPEIHAHLDVLASFHRDVASRFADTISRSLQRLVEVELVDAQTLTYSQYVYSRPAPTCYSVLSASPLPAPLAFDFSPSALYPMLDCMLGGGKHKCEIPDRPPTMLEQRLARRLLGLMLDELHDAWEPLLAVELSIERIESQPQRVRVVAPGEHVVALTFEVKLADQSGELSLCLPERAMAKVIDKLLAAKAAQAAIPVPTRDLQVCFDAEIVDSHRLLQLKPGDVLMTEIDIDGLVDVEVEGNIVGQGRLAAAKGRRAVVVS